MNAPSGNVLQRIVEHKRGEVAAAKAVRPAAELADSLEDAPPVRDFVAALRLAPFMGLIAEVKKASPSAGVIKADFDPLQIANQYQEAGANCLSVLTDEHFFQGHLDYLRRIRCSARVPLLRKDFLIDRYQVLEARVAGADAVLLIAECLSDCELRDLYFYASELGLEALIEVYDPENLDRVLQLDPPLVGVNNRDLRSFAVDLDQTVRLAQRIPDSTLLVSESGIKTRADVERLRAAGCGAILVGETLMRAEDVAATVRELCAGPRTIDV
ncbi:MAG: indole-3-glycerol phosphate synthase TrpC [Planctomycetaceae bacterium]|nr:indole-3-glycerol phosphate synthase TrpC [Planctomycetaceae bacterium]